MNEKQKSFEIKIRVPFFDLDPMQIVWHGNYLNYFEMARAALFEHNGVDLPPTSHRASAIAAVAPIADRPRSR